MLPSLTTCMQMLCIHSTTLAVRQLGVPVKADGLPKKMNLRQRQRENHYSYCPASLSACKCRTLLTPDTATAATATGHCSVMISHMMGGPEKARATDNKLGAVQILSTGVVCVGDEGMLLYWCQGRGKGGRAKGL